MTVEDIFNNLVSNKKLNTIPSAYIVKIALETIKILEQNNLIDLEDTHESIKMELQFKEQQPLQQQQRQVTL